MRAEDLRIGNWFKFGEMEHQATHYDIRNLAVIQLKNESSSPYQPIPLTGEKLLNFGATRVNNSMYRMGALTFQPTTFSEGENLVDKILNTRKAMRVCFCGKFLVNLEFVHQYQNLYHALTDKELTTKTE